MEKYFEGKNHFLLKEEAEAMFKVNVGKRLWDAEMVSEKARRRPTNEKLLEEAEDA